uniref:Sulfatase domain-containing protein n=1 Tax=Syphacia muris TaxID=451379 RepID=A0A0N5ABB7_9BILA
MQFMPKVQSLLQQRGVTFSSGFVSTPICCPSRTSILTGQYVHNHNVFTNNQNCSGTDWRNIYEKRTFAAYLQKNNYVTAYFGKYLNEYDGSYQPPGWNHWMGLIKNSRFYNYTVNFNGQKIKHGFDYERDYFTDLIANDTITFLQRHCEKQRTRPFAIVLSFPAPHGPEDPAPQYSDMFENVETHRTPSWNYAPNPDKQWILQYTGRMEPVHVVFTDLLHRRRLQTLQSVDFNIQRLFNKLRDVGLLSQTYLIYSSDHGYHLGQFGLVKGKNMPYEFDIRVPFFIRGPDLPKNIVIRKPVMNVDIAPTILDIAGIHIPSHMDGRSLVPLMRSYGTTFFGLDKASVVNSVSLLSTNIYIKFPSPSNTIASIIKAQKKCVRQSQRFETKPECQLPQMNCFSHNADHWRTPPLWPAFYGEFCFCQNANNNTYWCLRTVNDTHNFLYCEFMTDFISFYDLNSDPYQLKNIVWSVNIGLLEQLNKQLRKLHHCKGVQECEHYSSASWHLPFRSKKNTTL